MSAELKADMKVVDLVDQWVVDLVASMAVLSVDEMVAEMVEM
jgi:hypothetical protein